MSAPAPPPASASTHLAVSLANGKDDRRRLLSILNDGARQLVARARLVADEKNARGNIATKGYIDTRRDQYESCSMRLAKQLEAACRALAKAQQLEAERRVAVQDIEQAVTKLVGDREEQRKYMNDKVALQKKHAEELATFKATKGGKRGDAATGQQHTYVKCARRSRHADDEAEVDHVIDSTEAIADAEFAALLTAYMPSRAAKHWPKNAGQKRKRQCSVVSDDDGDADVKQPNAKRQRTGDEVDVKHNMADVGEASQCSSTSASGSASASASSASSSAAAMATEPAGTGVSPVADEMQLLSILSRS